MQQYSGVTESQEMHRQSSHPMSAKFLLHSLISFKEHSLALVLSAELPNTAVQEMK